MRITFALPSIALVCCFAPASPAQSRAAPPICPPAWQPTFGGMPGVVGTVRAFATFDDGSGPALYVAGPLGGANGVPGSMIMRFDGSHWSQVGGGLSGGSLPGVFALTVFDDGNGPALYAAGRFNTAGSSSASNIAKWNGSAWTALGSGINNEVYALCGFDDGSGPALYAGGYFTTAGGVSTGPIAKWSNGQWSSLGAGLGGSGPGSPSACALAVHDDGSGPALYVGGQFNSAGGLPASNIARWTGSTWSALGSGVNAIVVCMAAYDDGSGTKLFAGGDFTIAGGTTVGHLATWNGSTWSAVPVNLPELVLSMAVCGDAAGSSLYLSSRVAGTAFTYRVARLHSSWSFLPGQFDGLVYALGSYDDGGGLRPYIGGSFANAGSVHVGGFAKFDGTNYSTSGNGLSSGILGLAGHDDGSGRALFAAGNFPTGPGTTYVGKWNGSTWSLIGNMSGGAPIYNYGWYHNTWVESLAVFDPGGGPLLYAAGDFTNAGGSSANFIASWDGSQWHGLGNGMSGGLPQYYGWSGVYYYTQINALAVFDDGSGPALYAGGDFTQAGTVSANFVARWDGSAWSTLGIGLNAPVSCLAVYDDGSGPALYAGGWFTGAGGLSVHGIAKWNGSTWSSPGSGVNGPGGPAVNVLCTFDDGSGLALYAGGPFTTAGGQPANHLAKWNGSNWSAVGSGIGDEVFCLKALDDGSGPALYAGGSFTTAGGAALRHLARFDGSSWSPLGSGLTGAVLSMTEYDMGNGSALYFGGWFASCYDSGDSYLAKWGVPSPCVLPGLALCEPGSGAVLACPCSNPPSSAGRGCDNSAATGGAVLAAVGSASLAADSVALTTSGELSTALSIVLQGDTFQTSGTTFGQGVRCAAGSLKRLYTKTALAGSIHVPQAGDASLSARSAALGDPIPPGFRRLYGVYYRDPLVLGGCPATSTFNITQQISILWQP